MALIDLKTNLKNLKFGQDRPGGGSSNQPYIQKEIPTDYTNKSPDFLLRNGYLNPVSIGNDVSRLTQMFVDFKSPQGLLFIAKQNLLSRTGVATEASKGIAYGTSPTADYKKAALNDGIYSPLSTIAQAGISGLGGHLNKQGIDPSGLSALSINKYDDILKNQDIEDNRLYSLVKTKFPEAKEPKSSPLVKGFINKFKAKAGDVFNNFFNLLPEDESVILKYSGGPGSQLGIGNTIIRRYTKTGLTNPLALSDPNYFFGKNNRVINKTENSWKQDDKAPIGASIRYFNIKEDENPGAVLPDLTTDGGYTYEPNFIVSTTNPDTLELEPTKSPEQALRPYPTINKDKILGLSNKYSKITNQKINNFNENNSYGTLKTPSVYKDSYENQSGDLLKSIPQNKSTTYTQEQINTQELNEDNKIKDFRKDLIDSNSITGSTYLSKGPDYTKKNIENRVNLGNPGERKNVFSYKTGGTLVDKLNALEAYTSPSAALIKDKPINDLVKFRIAILSNDNPNENIYLHFRALINGISDQYTSNWNSIQYVGRGESFHNYTGFDRTFSLNFKVVAQSKAELIPMYKKLNILASSMAPDYTKAGFMRGNLVRLTVGGYLFEQVGFLKGITYTIPDESPWEIGINEDGGDDSSVKELPHIIDVSGFTFTPIHNFLPSKINNISSPTQRYIALSNGDNNNYDN